MKLKLAVLVVLCVGMAVLSGCQCGCSQNVCPAGPEVVAAK